MNPRVLCYKIYGGEVARNLGDTTFNTTRETRILLGAIKQLHFISMLNFRTRLATRIPDGTAGWGSTTRYLSKSSPEILFWQTMTGQATVH